MLVLSDQYVVEKFCQYGGYPSFNKRSNAWMAGCPICREGKSWGKKRRLYYKIDKNYLFCFNCGWKGGTVDFIKHVTGLTYREIVEENNDYSTNDIIDITTTSKPKISQPTSTLPLDSINLFDDTQLNWWMSQNTPEGKVIKDSIEYINDRKLNVAINRPTSIWLSLNDYVHKNRITLPFYSNDNKIIFYQSRAVYEDNTKPKYLSKSGGDKSIFNINNVCDKVDSIFIFEGPIDSCFVRNGVAVAGITNGPSQDLNTVQQEQLNDYRLYTKIWVLDSQWLDNTSLEKTKMLADQGEHVFIWPESIGTKYKDLNDLCTVTNIPGIGYKFIEKHSYTGMKAQLLLKNIQSNRSR